MEAKWSIRDLLKSNYTRHLEGELVRVRMEKDARVRELIAEKLELVKKVAELEMAMIPALRIGLGQFKNIDKPGPQIKSSTLEMAPDNTNWQQALDEHNRAQEAEWHRQKSSGPADVEK